MQKKGTVLIPSGPSHDPDRLHLHVVCTEPDDGGMQLIVSISSLTNKFCDNACVLLAHEHAFLNRESYVFYRNARLVKKEALDNGVSSNLFKPHDSFNGQAFLKIMKGFCTSKQSPKKIKVYVGCPGWKPDAALPKQAD